VKLREGRWVNVDYRLPETPQAKRTDRPPFSELVVEDLRAEVDSDLGALRLGSSSLTVHAIRGPSFEGAVQLSGLQVTLPSKPAEPAPKTDEICRLTLRGSFKGGEFAVQALELEGRLGVTPNADGTTGCDRLPSASPEERLSLRLADVSLRLPLGSQPLTAKGHVGVHVPATLATRFVAIDGLHGWVDFDGDVSQDGGEGLPQVAGRLMGANLGLGGYTFAQQLAARVRLEQGVLTVPEMQTETWDGQVTLRDIRLGLLEPNLPIDVAEARVRKAQFPAMMRDLAVTPRTIVAWQLTDVSVRKGHGTLAPLHIDSDVEAVTDGFELFDRAFSDPHRQHMIGVPHARVQCRFAVRPDSVQFQDAQVGFGKSHLAARLVRIGFDNSLELSVPDDAEIELSDIGPLVNLPIAGRARLGAELKGRGEDPVLRSNLKIDNFVFGGFPIGNIDESNVVFRPLYLDITDLKATKGDSRLLVPNARIDFKDQASILVDAHVTSGQLNVPDFLAMWNLSEDPRYQMIGGAAKVDAHVSYELGGPRDPCGTGRLKVAGRGDFLKVQLLGENYDGGSAQFTLDWLDRDAAFQGFTLDIPSISLDKGAGRIMGSYSVALGAGVEGHLVASDVPLSRLQMLEPWASTAEGRASGSIVLGGSLDAVTADAHLEVTPVRLGLSQLPASTLDVKVIPNAPDRRSVGKTTCGRPIPPAFDRAQYDLDRSDGTLRLDGNLFGGQLKLVGLEISQQRSRHSKGLLELQDLDLSALSELGPASLRERGFGGRLSGSVTLQDFPASAPLATRASATITALKVTSPELSAQLTSEAATLTLAEGQVALGPTRLKVTTPTGWSPTLSVEGNIAHLGSDATVRAGLTLERTNLSRLASVLPGVTRTAGTLDAHFDLTGTLARPELRGKIALEHGELSARNLPWPLTNLEVVAEMTPDAIRVVRGQGQLGEGSFQLGGVIPLENLQPREARITLDARGLSAAVVPGVTGTFGANLVGAWRAAAPGGAEELPAITGSLLLENVRYTRPVKLQVDLASLTRRGKVTSFEAYDPQEDRLRFDLEVRSPEPLRIRNDLAEADLEVVNGTLRLAGTNQRQGLMGELRVKSGGRLWLRRNEFEIQRGAVVFDDPTRIAPRVDLSAFTQYRRYSDTYQEAPSAAGASTATRSTGGNWRIGMHAYGNAEELKVDLTSEPALAQDDIFLLLTVGVTRAELDQSQSASVGESVALEALGNLSGADEAVTSAVPVIDDFRFGSAYSSRTGRTEPTITIGKRLAERIRANVTTGLAESREIRSNVEWNLSQRLSVEGSYDNVNDISSSSLGNLGADLRWRLEFE